MDAGAVSEMLKQNFIFTWLKFREELVAFAVVAMASPFATSSRPALGHSQSPAPCVWRTPYCGVEQPGRETGYLRTRVSSAIPLHSLPFIDS
jgi:hypothetical protein